MLIAAFLLLSGAVGLGAFLLAGRLRRAAVVHGGLGLLGLAGLVLAIGRGAFRGPFAWDAVGLAAAAAAGGATIFVLAQRRRRRPGLLVGLHAMAGGLAFLLLAGFVFGR